MKHFKFSRFVAIAAVIATLGLCACQQNTDDSSSTSIYGTWVESGSWGNSYYKITGFPDYTLENYGDSYVSYAGDNLTVVTISDSAGTIFIKLTRAADSNYNYTTDAPDVGKWYAISYKNLTDSTISISGAYKTDGQTAVSTLDEAKTEFTIDNGYFGTYSECTKE